MTRTYSFERLTTSIEYSASKSTKETTTQINYSNSITTLKPSFEDLSCSLTPVYYHPGIKGIIYRLT